MTTRALAAALLDTPEKQAAYENDAEFHALIKALEVVTPAIVNWYAATSPERTAQREALLNTITGKVLPL